VVGGHTVAPSPSVEGFATLRKHARTDVTAERFRHTLAQARLGTLGASIGAEVVVEPAKVAGPGDVLLRLGGREVFVEIVTALPQPNHDEEAYDRHVMRLPTLKGEAFREGDVPGLLNRADRRAWFARWTRPPRGVPIRRRRC
jgi:hypothetical protein